MSVENDQIIPVQVKYIEVQSATVLRNEKIPCTAPRKIPEPRQQNGDGTVLQQNGVCRSPVAPENIEISPGSPVMSPCAGSPTNPLIPNKFQFDPNLTYAQKVAHEMLVTEKIYLDNLKQIIDGFLGPVSSDAQLDVSQENIDDLFINVEEIYQFNWVLLQDMEKCNYDPVKLAECFVVKQIGFDIYTKYCTHYPRSMEVLLEWNQREDTANFIKRQQESLGHTLPLCSFLLKPVQRILKYHLLLGNIAKHFKQSEDEDGYEIIQKALSAMTNVAKHINDMKRKHEDALHLQEIQSVLLDYEGPNLTSFGSIVLEDTFRLHGTKTGRYLFLFEKALLITKRRSDGTFSWKATVMYSNMMLADSVFREPLTFQVIPFDDRKICYTFVSRDLDTKHVWLLELKRRLLDSYAAAVPMKAKQMILGNGRENNEKENAEPDSIRRSTTRKGANQQRQQPGKENSGQSTKLSKTVDSERRKYKDIDATIEEKTKMSIDSFKSPLRRKLRVFKKRKFSSKESAKSPKRVSWSSDDNNDESYIDKGSLAIDKENTNQQDRKVSTNSEPQYDANDEEKQNISEKKHRDDNDNEVSISSLLHDGKTMVSVTGEVDNHLSGHVKLRSSHEDILPSKKRRLTREKRQKCKSMPAGQFPMVNEFVTVDKNESTLTRAHSLSRLYEKFLESELIDTPSSVKELEKYGLVNFQENHTRTKRLGSYDEQLASEEGIIHRSSGDAIPSQADDVIPKTGQSVQQTMKRVSMAFSDISANFSTEKSPASSIEDLTTEDIEDLTAGDLTPDEYTAGDLTPEEDTPGDLSLDDGDTSSPIPDEVFNAGKSPQESNPVEGGVSRDINGYNDTDKNKDSGLEYKENVENGVTTDWNQNETTNNTYNPESIYEDPSNQDRHIHSEPNSCADALSDDSWDEQSDQSWLSNVSGSYQRVFTLKRSYSEENLVSKYPFDEVRLEDEPTDVASKSYTHFDHAPIMRSKSADCSKKPQSRTRPLTFSVTPKKKIVIKDSLWETIREHSETTPHEISVANDVHRFRRQRKRKSGHKKKKKNRTQSSDGRVEGRQHVVRTCAVLNMADYRQPKDENCARRDLKNKPVHRKDSLNLQKNEKNERVSTLASSSENMDKVPESVASNLQETFGSNSENITPDSREERANMELKKSEDDVTNIAVAMRKKKPKASASQEESLVSVDKNMSEVLPTVNYLCIETFPSEELSNTEEEPGASTRDVKRTNGSTASKVERLSKYFSKVTTENHKRNDHHMINHAETLRKGCSIKKRVEELSKHEIHTHNSGINSEEKAMVEGDSSHNIQNRIGGLRRLSSGEGQTTSKSRIELTSSLHHGKPNVQELKNRLEDSNHSCETNKKSSNGISKKVSTSLRIKNRIQELEQNPDKTPEQNVDDDLRACTRLKERIERLQKGGKTHELDTERDITISDDHDTSQTSPRQNDELRTVVIKRGWVQQFIQKIETGS